MGAFSLIVVINLLNRRMATFHNKIWEKANRYPDIAIWIMPGSSKKATLCRFCGGNDISLGNMGVGTLKSHTSFKKHKLMTTARAESGFPINLDLLLPNVQQASMVSL